MIIFCHVLFPSNGTAPLQDLEKLYASSETLLWKEAMSMSSTSLGVGCRLECTRTADLMGPVGSVASGPFCQRLCSKILEVGTVVYGGVYLSHHPVYLSPGAACFGGITIVFLVNSAKSELRPLAFLISGIVTLYLTATPAIVSVADTLWRMTWSSRHEEVSVESLLEASVG